MNRFNIFRSKQKNNLFPGNIYCHNCNFYWSKNYATEFCPECGVKVIDKPTAGFNKIPADTSRPFLEDQLNRSMEIMGSLVNIGEKHRIFQTIIQCPRCGYRCPKFPEEELKICPRCRISMEP